MRIRFEVWNAFPVIFTSMDIVLARWEHAFVPPLARWIANEYRNLWYTGDSETKPYRIEP